MAYERDAVGRVSAVTVPNDDTQEIIADQFTYRADGLPAAYRLGNRLTSQQDNQNNNFSHAPNSNRLTNIAGDSVTTDPSGNITNLPRLSGDLSLFYNQQNHLSGLVSDDK